MLVRIDGTIPRGARIKVAEVDASRYGRGEDSAGAKVSRGEGSKEINWYEGRKCQSLEKIAREVRERVAARLTVVGTNEEAVAKPDKSLRGSLL